MKKSADVEPGFEAALERLEQVVQEMESGALSLEMMIKHFEEGSTLVEVCSKKLTEVEGRIQKLVKKGDKVVEEPFDEVHS